MAVANNAKNVSATSLMGQDIMNDSVSVSVSVPEVSPAPLRVTNEPSPGDSSLHSDMDEQGGSISVLAVDENHRFPKVRVCCEGEGGENVFRMVGFLV